jgi:hypothetical protein
MTKPEKIAEVVNFAGTSCVGALFGYMYVVGLTSHNG